MRRHWEQIAEQEAAQASAQTNRGELGDKLGGSTKGGIAAEEVPGATKLLN
jgi:hypothetical protein